MYLYFDGNQTRPSGTALRIYGHALRGPPPPPEMIWEAPHFCGVGCGEADWESLLPLYCGVGGNAPLPGVGFGGVEFVLGSLGGLVVVVKLL